MTKNVLIIDDNEHFRHLLSRNLLLSNPRVNVHEYDPIAHGKPRDNFDWSVYDLVFLDHKIGDEKGVDWLKDFLNIEDYPRTVFLVDNKHLSLGRIACEMGADTYISKDELTRKKLQEAVNEAVDEPEDGYIDTIEVNFDSMCSSPLIKDYDVVEKISENDVCSVFLGVGNWDTTKRIIKILSVNKLRDEDYIDRFLQENELINHLNHPYIVKIYDEGITDEYLYMVMEYLPDGNLEEKIKVGIQAEQAVEYLLKIASGLKAIHDIGVIHRDIKPSNIMFRGDDPVIIDLGISKLINMNITRAYTGQVMGTPHYMSPEHGAGDSIDFRSDIYSLGVTFFEMLTGRQPYDGENPVAIVYKHLHAPIPKLPSDLMQYQPLIDGVMAKDPGLRFQTISELIKYIRAKFGVTADVSVSLPMT